MTDVKKKLNLAKATMMVKQQDLEPINLVEMFKDRGIDLTGSDNGL
ncbi:MAG: hypothetical protein IKM94_01205 [Alphaproteobacteria bacterium]|nr:hypothetical protein [Alphaproteobacteria bacterium]